MISFIWKNWRRRKERFILLLVGVFIISVGLAYLVGLSETNKGTIVNELEERWKSSYDIVVRPEGTRSDTEQDDLLDPNFLSGIDGGISMDQYESIKKIPNIDVAAPIAMIGYVIYSVNLEPFELEQNGIYRLIEDEITDDGIKKYKNTTQTYFPSGEWVPFVEGKYRENPQYYLGFPYEYLTAYRRMFIAGIDPEQEAELIGLDKAVMSKGKSRYFTKNDESTYEMIGSEEDYEDNEEPQYKASFPVIINSHTYADQSLNWQIERLDIPFGEEEADETLDELKEEGGEEYLDTLEGETIRTFHFNEQEIYSRMVNSIAGYDRITGEPLEEDYLRTSPFDLDTLSFPTPATPLVYQTIKSPFFDKWENAYQLQTFTSNGLTSFRQNYEHRVGKEKAMYTQILPEWIGYYDPTELDVAKDPLNELPMETYRPATAELVLDTDENPINPPQELKPTYDPHGYLANPPSIITTLEAAEIFSGDEPISAIRIKVAGVSELTEDSQARIEQVAEEIEQKTGLITDITLGSSPQPALVNVPELKSEYSDEEELGWFWQPWIKLGSSVSIFREAKVGFSGLIVSIIAVAAIYVWATSLVSLLARRKEFAVLLAVGWRPRQLSRLLFTESAILGAIVAVVSWLILGVVTLTEGAPAEPLRILLTGLFGFLIYILGAIVPAYTARKITPYEAIQTGEISKSSNRFVRTRGLISMATNHFIGKWKRSILSIVTIALPTSLLAVFLFITFRLKGTMYLSLLGEYVALEVGPVHYTATIIALFIAMLTTAEIMWQNIAERQEEIALLKAVGWKNRSVRLLIWIEGLLSGIVAAVIGLTLAIIIQWVMYGEITVEGLKFVLATGIVPIVVGILGTILPAERAVRISPFHGMGGSYSNRKGTEKRMKWILILAFAAVLGAVVYTVIQMVM